MGHEHVISAQSNTPWEHEHAHQTNAPRACVDGHATRISNIIPVAEALRLGRVGRQLRMPPIKIEKGGHRGPPLQGINKRLSKKR
ncbi:MAG: hypothetical protein CO189_07955 [candidate division Zixibacteria bacterium CG_4_9_14_3_um_filter_46_8]|nr:MAG: hypothetical protein CO189_07955 [candidate division Zixibacteria bacterium CG_4_9_14_3_um_filter_46_8]